MKKIAAVFLFCLCVLPHLRPERLPAAAAEKQMKVRFTAQGKEIVVRLHRHAAAEAFSRALPAKLAFSGYNSTEKIATGRHAGHDLQRRYPFTIRF